jgi:peptide-methionine (R)-S-oxide reductase
VIFSKTTCPYCARAKEVLESEGLKYLAVELDEMPSEETAAMQDTLAEMTGARTVPRIFMSKQAVGGCDDLVALQQSGGIEKIKNILKRTGFQIEKSDEEWRNILDSRQYRILRQSGTEPPGSSKYDRFLPKEGHFQCGGCGLPLYSASSKFASSCGWPVFDRCYYSEDAGGCHVGTVKEFGGLEIVCNRCRSHLGHVFFDAFGPANPNGERH